MKKYMKPELTVVMVAFEQKILAGSGVADGSSLGDAYNDKDVTYARGSNSVWDDEF